MNNVNKVVFSTRLCARPDDVQQSWNNSMTFEKLVDKNLMDGKVCLRWPDNQSLLESKGCENNGWSVWILYLHVVYKLHLQSLQTHP